MTGPDEAVAGRDEVIAKARQDLSVTPEDHPDRLKRLNNLAVELSQRFSRTNDFSDLEEAIELSRQAIAAAPEGHSKRAAVLMNHAGYLVDRFRATKVIYNLEEAIKYHQQVISITPQDDPDRCGRLGRHGIWLKERYYVTRDLRDLEEAIDMCRQSVEATTNGNPRRAILLNNYANALVDKILATDNTTELEKTMVTSHQAFRASNDDSVRAASLHTLAVCHGVKFSETKAIDELQKAIQVQQQAVALTPQHDVERPRRLNNLGILIGKKYLETRDITDLEEAIRLCREAVETTSNDDSELIKRKNDLMFWINESVSRDRATYEQNEAILVPGQVGDTNSTAGKKLFKVDAEMASCLQDLDDESLHYFLEIEEENTENDPDELFIYTCFLIFSRSQNIEYLDRAIQRAQSWLSSTPTENEDRARRFEILNIAIEKRIPLCGTTPGISAGDAVFTWLDHIFEGFTSEKDVQTAFFYALKSLVPEYLENSNIISTRMNSKANEINESFEATSNLEALDEAIQLHRFSLGAAPSATPTWAGISYNLALRFKNRAAITASLADANTAIQYANQALSAPLETNKDRGIYLLALGGAFRQRFELTGAIDDLDEAVKNCTAAIAACEPDHFAWSSCFSTLANALGRRFEMTGSLEDINRAVETASIYAGKGVQPDVTLISLCCWLTVRFERTGSEEDLDRAIEVITQAIDASPENGVMRHYSFANLGRCHLRRFENFHSPQSLDLAIEATTKAITVSPEGHSERARWLSNLGTMLNRRFQHHGSKDDLDSAIQTAMLAVRANCTDGRKCTLLLNLGEFLRIRFEEYGSEDDRKLCLASYVDGWDCRDGPPAERVLLAKRASEILISEEDWPKSASFLKAAVQLLPLVSSRALQHTDKQYRLGTYAGLTSNAAAASLNAGDAPIDALQLLEAGRGIISSSVMDMRIDVSELEQQHPELAAKFNALREVLDPPREEIITQPASAGNDFGVSQTSLRRNAEQDLERVLQEIRDKPGYHDFLLPPSKEELLAAADPDPIIIVNLSTIRSDAFIIYKSQINLVPLPALRVPDVQKWSSKLYPASSLRTDQMLKWLWDTTCNPILEALGFKGPLASDHRLRVWWIPTGLLSRLPLHAAGYHKLDSAKSVLDVVISSYASSVKALLQGRRRSSQSSSQQSQDSLLAVTMQDTPGLPSHQALPFVEAEWEMLSQTWSTAKTKMNLTRPSPRKGEVLERMASSKIFHFAGHGSSNPHEPSKSFLLLDDWQTDPLTVGDLRDCRFQKDPPFLGYLSACSTGANKAARLQDEGIHLIGALLLAGFQNVVGTLWEVSDKHCVDMARVVYQTLRDEGLTNMAVCKGLHRAQLALRDVEIHRAKTIRNVKTVDSDDESDGDGNWFWIPYVHYGVI
ncbi:CHAT domain-containing protein [Xylaria scruposa]|nr:CHAT domain-containing protein [Xylaria scruposa]